MADIWRSRNICLFLALQADDTTTTGRLYNDYGRLYYDYRPTILLQLTDKPTCEIMLAFRIARGPLASTRPAGQSIFWRSCWACERGVHSPVSEVHNGGTHYGVWCLGSVLRMVCVCGGGGRQLQLQMHTTIVKSPNTRTRHRGAPVVKLLKTMLLVVGTNTR